MHLLTAVLFFYEFFILCRTDFFFFFIYLSHCLCFMICENKMYRWSFGFQVYVDLDVRYSCWNHIFCLLLNIFRLSILIPLIQFSFWKKCWLWNSKPSNRLKHNLNSMENFSGERCVFIHIRFLHIVGISLETLFTFYEKHSKFQEQY